MIFPFIRFTIHFLFLKYVYLLRDKQQDELCDVLTDKLDRLIEIYTDVFSTRIFDRDALVGENVFKMVWTRLRNIKELEGKGRKSSR